MKLLSDYFSVQHGFHQFVPLIAQLQQEKGSILPQKVQEDFIPLPGGQLADKFPADPLQIPLGTVPDLAVKAVGGEQVHVLPFVGIA